jgi:uncharacterized protein
MLTLDDTPGPNLIRGYGVAGAFIQLPNRTLRASCLIGVERVIERWRPARIEDLELGDLELVFAQGASVVLLAMPAPVTFPAPRIRGAFGERRVGLEVMELGAACRTFNVLVQERRSVLGAFLIPGGAPEEDTGRESFTNQPIIRS